MAVPTLQEQEAVVRRVPVLGAGVADNPSESSTCEETLIVLHGGGKQQELDAKVKRNKNKKVRWKKNLEIVAAGCCLCNCKLEVGMPVMSMTTSTGEKRFSCSACALQHRSNCPRLP